ncbi:PQQ-binding-like beta-propeller repeat protein [Endozoicomonas arenosclerae]|uniref:outer membrane protein assembly factor BamB family protein n=1 Tax=Endozoicomonas arenosclerae TaxID=1633495 RepID=UPI000781D039|nr:PQQ-binding-like beta-propeller repeat protein [Endozoicomonas arenosclerae]
MQYTVETQQQKKHRAASVFTMLALVAGITGCVSASDQKSGSLPGVPAYQEDNQFLADSPYPTIHGDSRVSDYIEDKAPVSIEKAWTVLPNEVFVQPCSSGSNGQLYCTMARGGESGICNLVALDLKTGKELWRDVDPVTKDCILDEGSTLNNPYIDKEGHLYTADTQKIVSFDANGKVRWTNDLPSRIHSEKGYPNVPFGLNTLPSGELVSATVGDGVVMVVDRLSGKTLAALDLPSEKTDTSGPVPEKYLQTKADNLAKELWWKVGLGDSGYEIDNNTAVDPKTGTILISGGAPEGDSEHQGALWGLQYENGNLRVLFHVPMAGKGGIATSPAITKDGQYVLIGNDAQQLVAVDLPACLALSAKTIDAGRAGAACEIYGASDPVGFVIASSPTVAPDNRAYISLGLKGLGSFQISGGKGEPVKVEKVWESKLAKGRVPVSVITGFDNVIYFSDRNYRDSTHAVVAVDPKDGSILSTTAAGDAMNITMAIDPDTRERILIANIGNLSDEVGAHQYGTPLLDSPAGVTTFKAVE